MARGRVRQFAALKMRRARSWQIWRAIATTGSGMGCSIEQGSAGTTFVGRRNNSLSPVGRRLVLGFLAVLVLAISLGFAFHGAWLVLPFGGLDVMLVYLAFRYMERHAADYEQMSLENDRIVIERGQRGRTRKFEFNRHWVQAEYREPRGMESGKLILRSHGVDVEFGIYLTDEQRADVAGRLKEHLRIR
jgi:uncharacterized membrane protein